MSSRAQIYVLLTFFSNTEESPRSAKTLYEFGVRLIALKRMLLCKVLATRSTMNRSKPLLRDSTTMRSTAIPLR